MKEETIKDTLRERPVQPEVRNDRLENIRRFKIIKYDRLRNSHLAEDENGNRLYLDLMTDATFPELNENENITSMTNDEFVQFMEGLKGKTVKCEDIFPYVPCYFVVNGSFD